MKMASSQVGAKLSKKPNGPIIPNTPLPDPVFAHRGPGALVDAPGLKRWGVGPWRSREGAQRQWRQHFFEESAQNLSRKLPKSFSSNGCYRGPN